MKAKNIFLLYLLSGVLLFCSCKRDSFLDLTPSDDLATNAYWNTAADLENYANSFYEITNVFPRYNSYGSLGIYSVDDNSDNMVPLSVNSRLNGLNTVASNGDYAKWTDIYTVNYFLANYSKVDAEASAISAYVGEAYFLRACLYFNGVTSFGDLPWINKPLTTDDTALIYSPRLSRHIIIDSVIKDLDSAIALLPTKSNASAMRIYKEYAQGMKARICLYEGTWEKYHENDDFGVSGQDGTTYLQLAAEAADAVISSGTFQLDNVGEYNGYFNLFNQTDYSSSNEIMFWRAYNQTDGLITYWQNYYQFGSEGTCDDGISKSLVDAFLCTDGKPISLSSLYEGDDSLSQIVANRDPRLRQSIFMYGDTVVANESGISGSIKYFTYPALVSGDPNTTGFQIKKGLNTDYYQDSHNSTGGTDGTIYMRYAEILLIYAEAKAELGTITQNDIDITINELRARVNMPDLTLTGIPTDPDWQFPDLSPIINEVRRERRVELACEGYRLNDLMRWAAAGSLIVNYQPLGAKENQFATVISDLEVGTNIYTNTDGYILPYANTSSMADGYQFNTGRDYLLPISLSQITKANGKISQNPGW
ncbi:RagB/SusD family nutrient uptake outer membrane protein [Parafilimonas sp.]|uniref:RagB/SusD family nutrient uptake outer membrane protein n=1 Tax=Parafilimonas sp. TaxID=1969739 RepID=UPI0039E45C93